MMYKIIFNIEPKAQTDILGHCESDDFGVKYIAVHMRALNLLYPDEDDFIYKLTSTVCHETLHAILTTAFPGSSEKYQHNVINRIQKYAFDKEIRPEPLALAGHYDEKSEPDSIMYV